MYTKLQKQFSIIPVFKSQYQKLKIVVHIIQSSDVSILDINILHVEGLPHELVNVDAEQNALALSYCEET